MARVGVGGGWVGHEARSIRAGEQRDCSDRQESSCKQGPSQELVGCRVWQLTCMQSQCRARGSEDGLKDSASPTPAGVGQASILIPSSERSLLLSGPTLGCGKDSTKPRPPGGGTSFPVLMESSAPGTEN